MADLTSLGEHSAGVWSRAQARTLLTAGEIWTLKRTGAWQTVWPGVHADGGFVLDAAQRAFAAVIASGGDEQPVPFGPADDTGRRRRRLRAVAYGRTAARVWGFPLIDDDDPATGRSEHLLDDVAVWCHGRTLRRTDDHGRVRELRRHQPTLRDGELVQLDNGLWITSPVRTLADVTELLSPEALVCALDAALHRDTVTIDQLDTGVARRRGHPWSVQFAAAVALADGRAESPAETLARLLLLPVVPGLIPQVRLTDEWGRLLARFDLGDPRIKLAVEADGKRGHAGAQMAAKDHRRDRFSGTFGWTTERVTWFELRRQQSQVRARIAAVADRLASRLDPT